VGCECAYLADCAPERVVPGVRGVAPVRVVPGVPRGLPGRGVPILDMKVPRYNGYTSKVFFKKVPVTCVKKAPASPPSPLRVTGLKDFCAERIRGARGWHLACIASRAETSIILSARMWATLSKRPSAGCTVSRSRLFSLGLWSQVFHGNMGIRRAPRAVSRMCAARVGVSTKFPSLLLQCSLCRTREWGRLPKSHLGCGFLCGNIW
jgi:hypothetical protein